MSNEQEKPIPFQSRMEQVQVQQIELDVRRARALEEWNACPVMSRRALEGLTREQLIDRCENVQLAKSERGAQGATGATGAKGADFDPIKAGTHFEVSGQRYRAVSHNGAAYVLEGLLQWQPAPKSVRSEPITAPAPARAVPKPKLNPDLSESDARVRDELLTLDASRR